MTMRNPSFEGSILHLTRLAPLINTNTGRRKITGPFHTLLTWAKTHLSDTFRAEIWTYLLGGAGIQTIKEPFCVMHVICIGGSTGLQGPPKSFFMKESQRLSESTGSAFFSSPGARRRFNSSRHEERKRLQKETPSSLHCYVTEIYSKRLPATAAGVVVA